MIEYNSLSQLPPGFAPLLNRDAIQGLRECADILHEGYAPTLPYWSPWGSATKAILGANEEYEREAHLTFEQSPQDWTLHHLLLPAVLEHLRSSHDLSAMDSDEAQLFVADIHKVASSRKLSYRLSVDIAGVDLVESPLQIETRSGILRLRTLTDLEQGELLDQGGWRYDVRDLGYSRVDLVVPGPRLTQRLSPPVEMISLLTALQLHGASPSGTGQISVEADPAWAGFGIMRGRYPIARQSHPTRFTVDEEVLGSLAATMDRLTRYAIYEPTSSKDAAIHRFYVGHSRENPSDSLVDFTIALETLLLPTDPITRNSELGLRFKLHGAHYLAAKAADRRRIYGEMREIYEMRSRVVHGSTFPTPEELARVAHLAGEHARAGLMRAIHEKFPTPDHFLRSLLGD